MTPTQQARRIKGEERMSSAEFRATEKKPARSKYGNKKTVVDGIRFDSIAESEYYGLLKQREKAGEICDVQLQKPFPLLGNNGELIATYKCDFAFWDGIEGRFRVIDVKGFETKEFRLKRKMMKALLGIDVEVVKKPQGRKAKRKPA